MISPKNARFGNETAGRLYEYVIRKSSAHYQKCAELIAERRSDGMSER